MKPFLALGVSLLFSTSVLAQSLGERTGVNALVGTTPSSSDFVTEAAQSDMFEIQSSQLAMNQGDAATKTFAQRMIADHQKTTADLMSMVSAGDIKTTLPTAMASSQQAMLDKLRSMRGADFSSQYYSYQVTAHKDSVSLYDRYAKGGDSNRLKTWAGQNLPILQEHLKMAQDMNK